MSTRIPEDGYISPSWDESEESNFEFPIDQSKIVIPRSKMKFDKSIQISQPDFPTEQIFTFSKPLFTTVCSSLSKFTTVCSSLSKSQDTYSSIFKSQDTVQRSVTLSVIPLTEVTPKLFFGSFDDASDEENLTSLGITHIISLVGHKHLIKGMKHKHKPMSDYGKTDLKVLIKTLWSFIVESQEVKNKLFVHCQSGQNRSATVVLAILMKLKSGLNRLMDLYRMVKKKRPVIHIHEHYAKQLSEMEKEIFGETSVPKDWMKINSYDMFSGSVVFNSTGVMQQRTKDSRQRQESVDFECSFKSYTLGEFLHES